MSTYTSLLAKLQGQSLEALKQAQAAQLAALETIRQVVTELPTTPANAAESIPSLTEIVELNSTFAKHLFEQQSAYATQLATIFTSASKAAAAATERVAQTVSSN